MSEPAPPHVGHLIRLAQQIHNRMWVSEVSSEVTSPQMQVLLVLQASPKIDQRTAARLARLDRSTGAELTERLARHGYVRRRRDRLDRRRYLLELTSEGHKLVSELQPRSWRLHDRMLELVPAELHEPFIRALQCFVDSDDDREQGAPVPGEGRAGQLG